MARGLSPGGAATLGGVDANGAGGEVGRRRFVAPIACALVGLAAFLPALRVGLLSDDWPLVFAAAQAHSVSDLLTHDINGGHGPVSFYRPVWVGMNRALLGPGAWHPALLHAAVLVVFALTVLEVYALARSVGPGVNPTVAALLFAVYPQHQEAVIWLGGSSDVLATLFILAALLALALRRLGAWRLLLAAALALIAALSKESAFMLAPLALLLEWLWRGRLAWRSPATYGGAGAMVVGQLPALLMRVSVLGGVGGYAAPAPTPARVVATVASYLAMAVTPPQVDPLANPVTAAVPLVIVAVLGWLVLTAFRRRARRALTLAAFGLAWAVVALVPNFNTPADLSTANGERYFVLPSVGIALAVSALLVHHLKPRLRPLEAVAGVVAVLAFLSCVGASLDWVHATQVSDRLAAAAERLGPRDGELVLLSFPEEYHVAHIGGPSAPLSLTRPDLRVAACAPVQVREEGAGIVRFTRRGGDSFGGMTRAAAPFRVRVLGSPRASAECSYGATAQGGLYPGAAGQIEVRADPTRQAVRYVYFDGTDLVACCS